MTATANQRQGRTNAVEKDELDKLFSGDMPSFGAGEDEDIAAIFETFGDFRSTADEENCLASPPAVTLPLVISSASSPRKDDELEKTDDGKLVLNPQLSAKGMVYYLKTAKVFGADEEAPKKANKQSRHERAKRTAGVNKSSSKQAEYARQYRLKNKGYVGELEDGVRQLTKENERLRKEVAVVEQTSRDQRTEIAYLRAVLANDSALAPILGEVVTAVGLKVELPLADVTARPNRPKRRLSATAADDGDVEEVGPPGVCLHVKQGRLAIELCDRCSQQARSVLDAR